jgi:hypothetical protein
MDGDDPIEKATPFPWGEFLEELALTANHGTPNGGGCSISPNPTLMQFGQEKQ